MKFLKNENERLNLQKKPVEFVNVKSMGQNCCVFMFYVVINRTYSIICLDAMPLRNGCSNQIQKVFPISYSLFRTSWNSIFL